MHSQTKHLDEIYGIPPVRVHVLFINDNAATSDATARIGYVSANMDMLRDKFANKNVPMAGFWRKMKTPINYP